MVKLTGTQKWVVNKMSEGYKLVFMHLTNSVVMRSIRGGDYYQEINVRTFRALLEKGLIETSGEEGSWGESYVLSR